MSDTPQKTLLLVEDEAITAALETAMLVRQGYRVVHVTTGEESIRIACVKKEPLDLILMDIDLGQGMDGTQAAREILREIDIPVVFLSSHTEKEIVDKTEKITSYGYVVKNAGITVLDASIKMAFRLFDARRILQDHEKTLQVSEERFRSMVLNGEDLILLMDGNGLTTYVSPQCLEVLGYPAEKFLNYGFPEIIHPDDAERCRVQYEKVVGGDEAIRNFEYRILDGGGSVRWISHSCKMISINRRVIGILNTIRNITELKQVEEALRENEEKYRMLFDNAGDAIFILDMAGRIVAVNAITCIRYGYTEEELLAMSVVQIDAPEEGVHAHERIAGIMEKGMVQFDTVHLRRDGGAIPVEVNSRTITWNHRPAIMSICRDMTVRKEAEEARKKSEKLYRALFDQTTNGITIIDLEGNLVDLNRSFAEMLGYTVEELHGMNVGEFDTPESARSMPERIKRILNGESLHFEVNHYHRDGHVFPLDVVANSIEQDGKTYILSFLHDISERTGAEKALQELQAKMGAQELFSMLVDKASDGIWHLDKDFMTVYVNPAIEKMLGYTADEMAGRSWYDFGDPEWVRRAQELEKRRTSGISEPHQFLFIRRDGTRVLTRIATTPLYDDVGNFNGALGILSDITRQKETEDALKLRDILNNIAGSVGIGIVLIEPDYTIAWYNDIVASWFGPLAMTKGRNCYEVFEGNSSLCPDCPVRSAYATGKAVTCERTGIATLSDGPGRARVLTATPIFSSDGTILQAVEIVRDITDLKKTEAELRDAAMMYRTLVENSPDIIVRFDSSLRHIFISRSFEVMTGIPVEPLLGKSHREIGTLPEEQIKSSEEIIRRIFETGEAIEFETSLPGRSGIINLSSQGVPEYDEHGVVKSALFIHRDVTERKMAEDELHVKTGELEGFFNAAIDLLCIADTEGYFRRLNRHWEVLLGYRLEDLIGTRFMDLVHPDDLESTLGALTDLKNQMAVINFTNRYRCRDGTYRWIEWRSIPRGDLIYAAARDITERMEAEEKIRGLLLEKEIILKEVHHRIKNNMNTISGLLTIQADLQKNREAKEAILTAAGRISSMMVLYDRLYRSDLTGSIPLKEYLPALIDEIVRMQPVGGSIEVRTELDEFVLGSRQVSSLGIIINELITNAMKYAFAGRSDGLITITATKKEKSVTIQFRDNGIGLPEGLSFDNPKGFGLQLVFMLTKQLKGSVTIERGNGTSLIIEFPW